MRLVLQTRLQVDAVGPDVDVALGRQVALAPSLVFVEPDVLEPRDGRGRQARTILAEQGGQRRREVAGRNAFQIEDRDQRIEALRTPGVGWQDCRREPDARRIVGARLPVAHARLAHRHGPDARHDLALWQMPVPDDAPAAVVGLQIGGRGQKLGHFRFDRLGQKRPRPIAQNLGQPVGQNLWLNQFDNVIVGHGISLLRWRSGGSNTPTICRLPRFHALTNFRQ